MESNRQLTINNEHEQTIDFHKIENLPADVLSEIFQHLDAKSLMKVRKICKRFKEIRDTHITLAPTLAVTAKILQPININAAMSVINSFRLTPDYKRLYALSQNKEQLTKLSKEEWICLAFMIDDVHKLNLEHLKKVKDEFEIELKDIETKIQNLQGECFEENCLEHDLERKRENFIELVFYEYKKRDSLFTLHLLLRTPEGVYMNIKNQLTNIAIDETKILEYETLLSDKNANFFLEKSILITINANKDEFKILAKLLREKQHLTQKKSTIGYIIYAVTSVIQFLEYAQSNKNKDANELTEFMAVDKSSYSNHFINLAGINLSNCNFSARIFHNTLSSKNINLANANFISVNLISFPFTDIIHDNLQNAHFLRDEDFKDPHSFELALRKLPKETPMQVLIEIRNEINKKIRLIANTDLALASELAKKANTNPPFGKTRKQRAERFFSKIIGHTSKGNHFKKLLDDLKEMKKTATDTNNNNHDENENNNHRKKKKN